MSRPAAEPLSDIIETAEELFDLAPCGFLSARPDGTIVRVNQTLLDWTGHSRESLLGRTLRDLLPVSGQLFYETHYAPALRLQGFVREMALDLKCDKGSLLPVLVSSLERRDEAGRPTVVHSTIFDVTERRLYERELVSARRRAEQLAAVVESSADAILVISPEGVVQTWNQGAERLFGYSAAEAIGRTVRDLFVPPEMAEQFEHSLELLRSGVQVQMETVRLHKSGTRIEVSLGLTPHIEPPGELVAISAIIRDITERRRLELHLRRSEQLQSVATLAGGVAHEVNNQMAVVLGFGEFVLRALGLEHPQAVDVRSMVTAASRAAGISRQLLAFSRQLPITRRDVRLSELVRAAASELRRQLKPAQVLSIQSSEDDTVSVDPVQIEQVLLQLVRNAKDALGDEGRITVATGRLMLTEDDVAAHPADDVTPGDYVLLEVADTGTGMDPETLERAFEPFFTRKPVGEGIGLGLAVVHGVVKQHGGHVWVTSQSGQGTTVRVVLPVAGVKATD